MNKNGNGLRKNVNGTVDEQRRRSDGGGMERKVSWKRL